MSTNENNKTYTEFEDSISSKWLLWLGAITMAFGGIFLVKYSIESNILPPIFRVGSGALFGFVLAIGGEKIRRVRKGLDWWKEKPDYLPSAISASGLFILFASVFSAYALYDLISSQMAYTSLAIIAFGASYLALFQGRFFAYLGLVGGMLIPALVSTGVAEEWGLFPYLLMVTASSLWVSRKKDWTDIAASSLGLSLIWTVLWIVGNTYTYDLLPIGLFVLTIGALNNIFLRGASPARSEDCTLEGLIPTHAVTMISDLVTLSSFGLLVTFVQLDDYSMLSLTFLGVAAACYVIGLIRFAEYDIGTLAAVGTTMATFVIWQLSGSTEGSFIASELINNDVTVMALVSSVIISVSIFINLHKLLRKELWALVGVAYPILSVTFVYATQSAGEPHLVLAGAALVFATFFALATLVVMNNKEYYGKVILAAYSSAATMALSLSLAFTLQDAWLTLSFALEIVALALIWKKLEVKELRIFAFILAAVVIVRLLFNPEIFGYQPLHEMPVFNWLFYGYGLTAILFAYAARVFKSDAYKDHLVELLHIGSVLLAVAFTTLEIHVLFAKAGDVLTDVTAFEMAAQTANWAIASTILYWFESKNQYTILAIVRKFLMALTVAGMILGGGFLANIFTTNVNVGPYVIFNLQLLQYFVPAVLYGYKAYLANTLGRDSKYTYGGIAFLLTWYWITAEVFHAFHPYGSSTPVSDWEWYSYSAAWLVYTLVILLGGMRFGSLIIRKVGLGLLAFVILKVFLFDMDHLEGIARALSFMGLGGTMIGIGYLYQRMMSRAQLG